MDTEDESTAYLKLFNEGTHNYLLHSTDDSLNDAFSVESIFTEITPEWPAEGGLPILLSGSVVSEENPNCEVTNTNNTTLRNKFNERSIQNKNVIKENSITFYSNVDKKTVILSNDVLLRLEENEPKKSTEKTVTHVINGNTYSVTYTQGDPEEDEDEKKANIDDDDDDSDQVIHLLNADGTVTTFSKSLLDLAHIENRNPDFHAFYTKIQAYKCKLCDFLCENVERMCAHAKEEHDQETKTNRVNVDTQDASRDIVCTQMTSILNGNTEKKKYMLYLCNSCGNGYSAKEDLKQHMISTHNMVPVSETSNSSTSDKIPMKTSPKNEKKHSMKAISTVLIKKQKAMRKFSCSIKGCPSRFDKEEVRRKHEECHIGQSKNQFMCPECKSKFAVWRICCSHMWKCHSIDVGLLTCPMCKKFKSYCSMRVINHMAIHGDEKPFLCTSCGKGFKQQNQLYNHEIIHKPPAKVPPSFSQQQCELCQCYFASSKSLKKHIKFVHDKFKPFICNICGHETSRKEMMELHYRQHTGDKPFHCPYCVYKTGDRNSLRRHFMRHIGIAKYSCPYCRYNSIQSAAYKAHLASKHPGKEGSFGCTICRFTTVNLRFYISHVKSHELEQKKQASVKVEKRTNVEDSESKSSDGTHTFLNNEHSEEPVDTGGITIPASFDLSLTSEATSS